MNELTDYERKIDRIFSEEETINFKGGTIEEEYKNGVFVLKLERY